MKNVRILLVAVALAASACSGAVADPKTQTEASALTKAPVASTAHGPVKLVGEALGEVSLRADQRTKLEQLAVAAEARHAAMATGWQELLDAVAAQIEAGAIDRPALQAKLDKATADAEAARTEDRAALVQAHAVLDATQRSDFVDAFHAKMKELRGEKGGFGRLVQLKEELKLTDDQVSQIKAIMKSEFHGPKGGWKGREHGPKKALESFRGDSFDGSPFASTPKIGEGAAHMLDLAEKILPILTAEQRGLVAGKIRALKDGLE